MILIKGGENMPNIKPISDLRNYSAVLEDVTVGSPVYLTKNGHGCYTIMDINEQKEASDMLEEALEQARIANTAKTSFLARISHDIRTPMNGIIGLIDINDKHADDIAFMAKNRKKAKVAANHLLSLINDVLQLSKLEVYITGSCNTG